MLPKSLQARWVLAVGLVAGLFFRLAIVLGGDEGIVWPDEVYQSFEPAHRLVFGHGLVAWEFVEGARNWALPGFVAFWMKLSALFGGDSPVVYVHVVKLVFALLSLGAAWGVYRLAVVLGARELPAAVAAGLWGCSALALYFGHRAMSENASALPVVWGLALVLEEDGPRRRLLLGASLLGVATLLRLQAGVFCAGALLILAGRALAASRRAPGGGAPAGPGAWPSPWRRVAWVAGVLLLWAVAYGALDAATWSQAPGARYGGWFHSAVVYLRFNLIEGRAAGWGTSPWFYYLKHLFLSMPGVALVLGVGVLASLRRAPGVALLVLAFLGLHMGVAHKELRFILPVLPVACALVGVALSMLPPREGEKETPARFTAWVTGLVLLAVGWSAARHRFLTMGDIGSYLERGTATAWDDFGNVNRLLLAASRQKDLCGLRIDVAHLAWTGGATYLHTNAMLYSAGMPPQQGYFNYVITFPGSGGEVMAQDHGIELVRIPGLTTCRPYPGYTWRLP
ncbi:MAG: hypothetical protein IT380_03325 [Myxococcales bacterium]|nr:hypothetical protein [Myxococcales bacterium]